MGQIIGVQTDTDVRLVEMRADKNLLSSESVLICFICLKTIKVQAKDLAFSKKYLAFKPSPGLNFPSDLTILCVWVICSTSGLSPKGG